MPDDSIDEPVEESSAESEVVKMGMEIPVPIDTLLIDGIRPEKGDSADIEVAGTISRIRDDCAYLKVETVNDQPIKSPAEHGDAMTEPGLMAMSEALDKSTTY